MRLWGMRVHHKAIAKVSVLWKHMLGILDIRMYCHKWHHYYLLQSQNFKKIAVFRKSE